MSGKINMSELITEIAGKNGFYEPEVKNLIQDIFIPAIIQHLKAGDEVVLSRFGTFYTKKSQKPTLDGRYLRVPRFRASPVAKKPSMGRIKNSTRWSSQTSAFGANSVLFYITICYFDV